MTPNNREELVELMARTAAGISPTFRSLSWANMPQMARGAFLKEAAIVLTALDSAGIALAPKVATEEMCANANDDILHADDAFEVYTAMINASPFKAE